MSEPEEQQRISQETSGSSLQRPSTKSGEDPHKGTPIYILVSGGTLIAISLVYTLLILIFTAQKDYSPGLSKAVAILEPLYFAAFGIFLFSLARLVAGGEARSGLGMAVFGVAILAAVFLIIAAAWNIALVFHPMTPRLMYRGSEGLASSALGVLLFLLTRSIVKTGPQPRSRALILSCSYVTMSLFIAAGLLFLIDALAVFKTWKAIAIFESAGYVAFGALFVLLSAYMRNQDVSLKYGKPAFIASIISAGLAFDARVLYSIWVLHDGSGGAKVYLLLYGISLIAMSVMLVLFAILTGDFVKRVGKV